MKILLSNDDGIMSEGLRLLAIELQKEHDVYIVAPDRERSASSHSISIKKDLVLEKVNLEGVKNTAYSLTGTPADCIRVAFELLYKDIDVVFSGINKGYNAGADVQYSGTVSVCAEANLYNIPGVAVSAEFRDGGCDYEVASKVAPMIFNRYKDLVMGSNVVLNLNVPKLKASDIKGIKVCELGELIYDSFSMEEEEEGKYIVKLLERTPKYIRPNSDQDYLTRGYITVTPIEYTFHNEKSLLEYENINY